MRDVVSVVYSTKRRYGKSIAILVDGSVINPATFTHGLPRGGVSRRVVSVGGDSYEVVLENHDSRRGILRVVRLPRSIVLAIVSEAASSSDDVRFTVRGEGKVERVVEYRLRVGGSYQYREEHIVYYYVNGDGSIRIPVKNRLVNIENVSR